MGRQRLQILAKRGLFTRLDLMLVPPVGYRDRRLVVTLADAEDQKDIVFIGKVVASSQGIAASGRPWLRITVVDGDDQAILWFFNQIPFFSRQASVGQTLLISGKIGLDNRGQAAMTHPELCPVLEAMDNFLGVKPIYRIYPGVPAVVLKRILSEAIQQIPDSPKTLPEEWLKSQGLPDPLELLSIIHQPPPNPGTLPPPTGSRAYQRLATFELMFWRLLILSEKSRRETLAKPRVFQVDPAAADKFVALLPYTPTTEQIRAAGEFIQDSRAPKPLNRLLQGEVGSGKTVVAGMVASLILAQGRQVALLAPTELLARQHYEFLGPLMEKLGHQPTLLTSALTVKERRRILQGLAEGKINLAIGTQSLLSASVIFQDLGLAIIDEQQRFGVRQRMALARKSPGLDLMSMSATPIPRSFAQILYGDLDITSIHGSIPGRRLPITEIYDEMDSRQAYDKFFAEVRKGQQGFVVCPRIGSLDGELEEDPGLDPFPEPRIKGIDPLDTNLHLAIPQEYKPRPGRDILAIERLIRYEAPDLRLGVIHGRQEPALRHKTMAEFRAGNLDILAATSIIEVGVDVPGANLMLVEGADIFGLSQLHQLRGRVGRGGGVGLFFAVSSTQATATAVARLKALKECANGFQLAEMDMTIRGPGEELGLKQSGWPTFKFVKLPHNLSLLPKALELADDLWSKLAQWPDLEARLAGLAKELAILPEETDPSLGV
jgi:ATP-dependent DNA helicase RecG